jgi:hypothetical protein
MKHVSTILVAALSVSVSMAACADGTTDAGEGEGDAGEGEGDAGEGEGDAGEGEGDAGEGEGEDLDIPPTTPNEVSAWLATGRYLDWSCEAEKHAPRAPSPHPDNRVCSNPILSASTAGAAIPVGAASVKEIYDGANIVAYAVGVKVTAGGATDGAAMYWYEDNGTGTVDVTGLGNGGGVPQTVCFDCHSHGPDAGGQEQFFTIVR